MNEQTRRLVIAVGSINTASALPFLLLGGLGVEISRDVDLSERQYGLALGAVFLTATLFSRAAGRLTDGRPVRIALRTAGSIAVVALAGLGRAGTSLVTLAVFAGVGGLAFTLAEPASNAALSRHVPARNHGLAFGVKQASFPIAGVIAGISVPTLSVAIGWRNTLLVGACFAALSAVSVPRSTDGERIASTAEPRLRSPMASPHLFLLTAAVGLGSAASAGLSAFLVLGGADVGMEQGPAGVTLAIASACGVGVRVVAGSWLDRRRSSPLILACWLCLVGAAGYALLATQEPALFSVGAVLALAGGWGWLGAFQLAVVRLHPASPGDATGFVQTGTYLGAFTGPSVFGFLAGSRSYGLAWAVAGAWLLIAALTLLAGRRRALSVGITHDTSTTI